MADSSPANKIDPELNSTLEKGEKANIMIKFASTSPVLENLNVPQNASRGERASAVQTALEAHRIKCQAGVEKILTERNVKYNALWVSNSISVSGADKELVQAIAGDPEVVKISKEQVAYLMEGGENN